MTQQEAKQRVSELTKQLTKLAHDYYDLDAPSADDYEYDIIRRYDGGELTVADSIKVDKEQEFLTVGGRKVYGGGGIIPDIFRMPVILNFAF